MILSAITPGMIRLPKLPSFTLVIVILQSRVLFPSHLSQSAKVYSSGDWLAFDIYPEYKLEQLETIKFLTDIVEGFPKKEF